MIRWFMKVLTILVVVGEVVSVPLLSTASLPRRHVVDIRGFQFQPQRVMVAPGDTIVWINRDIVPHTVTASGGTWRSHQLEEGQSWEIVVEQNGPLTYFCEFHPHMTGELSAR